mmetsp:Transcript_50415/g.60765  ORF Transcript_50415/g.60765 Transcript_50415/m.60765 type:complete len:102 (-) Transcript_50415:308-613(-)
MDSNHHHIRSYSRRQRISHCIAVAVVYRIVSPSHRRITSPHRTSINVVSSSPFKSSYGIIVISSPSYHCHNIIMCRRHHYRIAVVFIVSSPYQYVSSSSSS